MRSFRDMEDLNNQVEKWLTETANTRIHGTTGEIPRERLVQEINHLLSIPEEAYVPMISLGWKVSRDGYISYNGNDYSLPEGLSKGEIEVRATVEEVRLYQKDKLIALPSGTGGERRAPSCPGLPARPIFFSIKSFIIQTSIVSWHHSTRNCA